MFQAVARGMVLRWKWSAAFVSLVTLLALAGFAQLSFDVSPNAVFTSENQTSRELDRLYADFGHDDNDIVVVLEGDDFFTVDKLNQLRELRDQLRAVPEVEGVASLFDLRDRRSGLLLVPRYLRETADSDSLRQSVAEHPIAANQFVSGDGRMLVFLIHVAGESLPLSKLSVVVADVEECAREFERQTGQRALLAGHLAIRAETLVSLRQSMVTGSLFATAISALVALILFRGWLPVLICCTPPVLGVVWTMGAMGWTGQQIGALGTVIPTLVMVIGLTDAVHLLLEANRQLSAGNDRPEAIYQMLRRIGPACLLTSVTTVIGFGSLTLSETYSVQQFGLCAALGSALALLSDLLVLPLLIRMANPGTLIKRHQSTERQLRGSMDWIAMFPTRYSRPIALIGIIGCLLLVVPAFRQSPDIIWTETLPADSDATIAINRADSVMGGALRAYVVIEWPQDVTLTDNETLRVAGEVHQAILNTEGMEAPFSVLNILASVPGKDRQTRYRQLKRITDSGMDRLVNESRRRLVVSALVPNDGAARLDRRVVQLERLLDGVVEDHPDFDVHVTGTVVAAARNMRSFIGDLGKSIAVASVIIFIVLTVAFRSLRMGLISIVPNAFPLLVTAAGLVLLSYPLQITSALTFSLCLGLAVDDTIHVMMRYRQLKDEGKLANTEIVAETIRHVGPALAITTAILVTGFGAMLVSPMPGIQMFALLSCIILLTAFVGDLLVLPAMLVVFGRKADR
ncbi:MAG: efflux RND transporter permease subunit [Rubripirellula sp.]